MFFLVHKKSMFYDRPYCFADIYFFLLEGLKRQENQQMSMSDVENTTPTCCFASLPKTPRTPTKSTNNFAQSLTLQPKTLNLDSPSAFAAASWNMPFVGGDEAENWTHTD